MKNLGGELPSVMPHNFARVPRTLISRSVIDKSHGHKTTMDPGWLVPVFWDEVLPGASKRLNMTALFRMQTAIHPMMDNMVADVFFFFCPERLLWTNFVKMMGEQDNPTDSIDYSTPVMVSPAGGYAVGSLYDYLGIRTGIAGITHRSALMRFYNRCYNEWFRSEDLQDSVVVDMDNGPDDPADYELLRRGKRYDYFTSALPWTQKGGEDVMLPLAGEAPVLGIGIQNNANAQIAGNFTQSDGSQITSSPYGWNFNATNSVVPDALNSSGTAGTGGHQPNIRADLSQVDAVSVNEMRVAFQTQRMLEKDARGGTRYPEITWNHFGTRTDDGRLQRVELLAVGSIPIHINPIVQTSETATTPLGELAGVGVATGQAGFSKSFTEHGFVMGLVSIRADLNYQQGLRRAFSRRTRLDFPWPTLAHLGEQAILNQEIYCQGSGNPTADAATFGYVPRYDDVRYMPSLVTGKFRSDAAGSLDPWHLAQDFSALPVLGPDFIVENPPISRVVEVTTEPSFYVDMYFKYRDAQPLPAYSIPGHIDHF